MEYQIERTRFGGKFLDPSATQHETNIVFNNFISKFSYKKVHNNFIVFDNEVFFSEKNVDRMKM